MDELVISVPSKLNLTNIHEVFCQVQDVISGQNVYGKFILDTTKMGWVEPGGIVALAALIKLAEVRKMAKELAVRHHTSLSSVESYLCRMNFFETLGFDIEYPYSKHDGRGRFCELIEVDKEMDVKSASNRIISILENKFGDNANKVTRGIAFALEEVMFNVFHHSESETPCYICAQGYKDKVAVSVVDCGVGYKEHLRRTYNHIETDTQAIEFALEKYITGNSQPDKRSNTGVGLHGTKNLVLKNNGEMIIYTGQGSYELINGEEKYYDVPEWKGTIISFTFYLGNPIDTSDFYDDEFEEDDGSLDDIFK